MTAFYGAEPSLIHHGGFGDVAESAAGVLVRSLAAVEVVSSCAAPSPSTPPSGWAAFVARAGEVA